VRKESLRLKVEESKQDLTQRGQGEEGDEEEEIEE
jgi:hypothetical protein